MARSRLASRPLPDPMPFGRTLVHVGELRPEVVVLVADLARYVDALPFAERFPDRFFQMRMSEQNTIRVATSSLNLIGAASVAPTVASHEARHDAHCRRATPRRTDPALSPLCGLPAPRGDASSAAAPVVSRTDGETL